LCACAHRTASKARQEHATGNQLAIELRDQWQSGGAGTVLSRPQSWTYLQFQMGAQWA